MFEQIGEFKPDSLIAGNQFPIMKIGIGLKAGQGILKRGSLIAKKEDGSGYMVGTTTTTTENEKSNTLEAVKEVTASDAQVVILGILTDDYDTETDALVDNIPATVYQTGEFNRAAVIVGEDITIENYEEDMRKIGIYLRSVQNYD